MGREPRAAMMPAAEVNPPETTTAEMTMTTEMAATVMTTEMTAAVMATSVAAAMTTAMATTVTAAASRQRRARQQRCNRNHGNSTDCSHHRTLPQSATIEASEIDGTGN